MKERIKTHIVGLDKRMSGGIPKGHIILVEGMPGTMKSSVAYNILYHNAKLGIKGMYISLEQARDSIIEHMTGLGMPHTDVQDNVNIVDLGFLRKSMDLGTDQNWIEIFKMYAENLRKTTSYELLVIDSLPVIEMLAGVRNRRLELFELFEWLRGLSVTTFIVSESTSEITQVRDEDFLADGVIHLRTEKVGSKANLHLGVFKMRETKHDRDYYPLMVENGTFEIVAD
jgi:KaiC/GvpD/RAD55 family RecA-like ATPase